tara:strand:- start:133 stop:789 length:657 start_codon:yes stop_codon:yes gene_type:complete
MQLTTEQIEFIDTILVLNGFKFEDTKMEIMDHIASEIEVKMDENKLSFDENFKIVLDKWSEEIKPSSSFLTGLAVNYPKIILEKKVLLVKKQLAIGCLFSLVVLLLFLGLNEFYDAKVLSQNFQIGTRFLYLLAGFLLVVSNVKILNSKNKTSFKHNFRERQTAFLMFVYPICFSPTPENFRNQLVFVIASFWMVYSMFLVLEQVKKHFQFEKRLTRI